MYRVINDDQVHEQVAALPIKLEASTADEALGDRVRVMTMHRAKGLEFRAVAVVGVDEKDLPPPAIKQLEGEERDVAWRRERNLLYVSGSRARERLYVSWVGKPSELIALTFSSYSRAR